MVYFSLNNEDGSTKEDPPVPVDGYTPLADITKVTYLQPHWQRRKQILSSHPEIKSLMQPNSFTVVWVVSIVALLSSLSWMVKDASLVTIFILSYTIGAVLCHAQWVLVHELTHDLVFPSHFMNTFFLLIANIIHILPTSVAFRYHHRMHHGHLNEVNTDPDLPFPIEDRIFGGSMAGKAMWLSCYSFVTAIRTIHNLQPFEWATVFNVVLNVVYSYCVAVYLSPYSLLFLFTSSMMSVGFFLHPLGTRWLAEHWVVYDLQETYSCYGPINKIAFNVGYHNEHHDFSGVPWNNLPKVRELAPEFYNTLYYHLSYFRLLWYYLSTPSFTLKSRVVRPERGHLSSKK